MSAASRMEQIMWLVKNSTEREVKGKGTEQVNTEPRIKQALNELNK